MNAVVPQSQTNAQALEKVLIGGDLSQLTAAQRIEYYNKVCESAGLNPLTRPFEYLTLNQKLTLYARKDCTDQLRKLNGISIQIVKETMADGLMTVHVRATDKSGRTDEDYGVVAMGTDKGEKAANAMLKCVTKAKRRVTLSISGLGFLDETEVEDIPAAAKRPVPVPPPAPKTTLTPEEEAALDRQAIRNGMGETIEEDGDIDAEVISRTPAQLATAWAKDAIEKARTFKTREQLEAWYTPAIKGAVGRLGDHDKGLQNILVEAIIAAEDRLLVTP